MFKRQKPKPLLLKFKNLFWPCMGWSRLLSYYKHRVGRMRGSPEMIAAGFASGVAVSFTPLMGFHFIMGILLALIVRGSLVASIFGTFIGNPWTFPIIWMSIYKLGLFITGANVEGAKIIKVLSFREIWDNLETVFLTMLIGSIPFVITTWFLSYYIIKNIVAKYQKRRKRRLQRKTMQDFKDSSQ